MRMKKVLFAICSLVVFNFSLIAGNRADSPLKYNGFTGGMMVHTGYLSSKNAQFIGDAGSVYNVKAKGMPFGIGGALMLKFGEHLRVGTEGYSSNLKYGEFGSYEHIGWGGVLVSCAWERNKWTALLGTTIGGGGVKNVTVLTEYSTSDFILDNQTSSYRKYSFMCVSPFVAVEYAMTKKIHLIMKMDCLCNLTARQNDFAFGPRLYFGFMFCH